MKKKKKAPSNSSKRIAELEQIISVLEVDKSILQKQVALGKENFNALQQRYDFLAGKLAHVKMAFQ